MPKWVLQGAAEMRKKEPKATGVEVFLTGATSFPGSFILQLLTSSDLVSKVHCVVVQADDLHSLPPSNEKVVVHTGSLRSPALGLTEAETRTLEERIGVIVHTGANGHCLNRYLSVRAPNVHSTRFLASLAIPRGVPIRNLSASRVGLLSGTAAPLPMSMAGFRPLTDGS